ncbi:hypothetical protein HYW59_03760 [Candidatus Kaiserbacteria bacterium]|nr:hypothetical protein [Candidatus Kaiserbacteria bacterium]
MRRFIFLAILLFPAFIVAATIQAGFPSQSIWVSSQSATEGETVVVSAVVVNGAEEQLHGTLVFFANDSRIGAREFTLPANQGQIHSIEWKPNKGEYKLLARIEGTSAELSQKETPPITVTVQEPPAPPSEIERTITQVVQTGSSIASSSAPVIIQTAQNIFAQTESLRNAGIERLENYLASNAASQDVPKGSIAGTSTRSTSSGQASNSAGFGSGEKNVSVLSSMAQTAAAGALFAFKNIGLFYPVLAFLILGTLYLLARRVRRKPRE